MEVAAFLVADHAEAVGGKIHLTGGGWDRLMASDIPFRHPHLSLAIALRVPWQSTNQEHDLRILLKDEDDKVLLPPIESKFEVGRPPGMRAGAESTVLLAAGVNNVEFKSEGAYSFVLEIDGSPEARAPFSVVKVQAPPPQTRG